MNDPLIYIQTSNLNVKNITNSHKTFLTKINGVCKFTSAFRECLSLNNITANTYVGHTTTTLSHPITYHLSDISAIKQHLMTKHNKNTYTFKYPDIRKILYIIQKSYIKDNYIYIYIPAHWHDDKRVCQ